MVGTLNERIGTRLRYLRLEAGLSTLQMADLLGVSDSHYRKIERGVYELKTEKLFLLRERLGADPLYLLTGEDRAILSAPPSENQKPGRELRIMQDIIRYCGGL